MRRWLGSVLVVVAHLRSASAQSASGPVNDLPNPYRTVLGWARLP